MSSECKHIRLLKHDHSRSNAAFEMLSKEFGAANPGVEVDVVTKSFDRYYDDAPAMLRAGEADIVYMHEGYIPELCREGLIAEVNLDALGYKTASEMISDFLPGALEVVTCDGDLVGVPLELNSFSLALNLEHFEAAGIPVPDDGETLTWQETLDIARNLTVATNPQSIERAGFDAPFWTTVTTNAILTASLVSQHGGAMMSDDGRRVMFNTERALQGFEHWRTVYTDGKITNPGFGKSTSAEPVGDLVTGRASMYPIAPWGMVTVVAAGLSGDIKVIDWPEGPSGKGNLRWSWALLVNAKSDCQSLAWQLVAWMITTTNMEKLLQSAGYIVPRKAFEALTSKRVLPHADTFLRDAVEAKPLPRSSRWPLVAKSIYEVNRRSIVGGESLVENLAREEARLNRIFEISP